MLYVSIVVELLRARPALSVWLAALMQAALWILVPTLFYSGPPGDVPAVLAIGHEFGFNTDLGPPVSFWLAEIAFRLAGGRMIGVYALSQVCVVATYWIVFMLSRALVGAQHAALAVLLMAGIMAFTVPTPDFGPVTLTMPLWALMLLHYWRAVTEGHRGYWVALAIEAALLLFTTYAALLYIAMLALFTATNSYARRALRAPDPWIAGVAVAFVTIPHLVWMGRSGAELAPALVRLRAPEAVLDNFTAWLRLMAMLLAAHAGLALIVALVAAWPRARFEPAPVIVRRPIDDFTRQFAYFFAVMPALAASCVAVIAGNLGFIGGIAPLAILAGLAVVVAAGDAIKLTHQHAILAGWFGVLLVPPLMTVLALVALPFAGVELSVNQPADAMARFFSESFQRRTGVPVPIVTGDPRTAALVALGSRSRPSLFLPASPARSPWVTLDDIKTKGAILVWPTTDTAGTPPAVIRARFPDLVPEVPRAFERPIAGQLGLLRIGWAMIRPQGAPPDLPEAVAPPAQ